MDRALEAEAALVKMGQELDAARATISSMARARGDRLGVLARSITRLRELLSDVAQCAELGEPLGEELAQRVLEELK